MADDRGEFSHIDWVRQRVSRPPWVRLGIGDDAAVVRFSQTADCLVAVDMLMEGVHFTIPPATPREVGRKALAVNLSDMAAMAGRPVAAVVSMALPRQRAADDARELHLGMQELADEFGVPIVGGDTNSWDGPFTVSVTVLGEVTGSGPVLRGGAQPGDWILVTGQLGGSLSGKHLAFRPRIEEALRLHESVKLHAMIDVSDGLSADLHHLLEESHVGAILVESAIPISEAAIHSTDDRSPLDHALSDGEDFELLFTVNSQDAERLLDQPLTDVPFTHIGEIVEGSGCRIKRADGSLLPLQPAGWVHRF